MFPGIYNFPEFSISRNFKFPEILNFAKFSIFQNVQFPGIFYEPTAIFQLQEKVSSLTGGEYETSPTSRPAWPQVKKVQAKAPSQIDTFVKDVSFARNISFLYAFIACCRLRLACTEFHILVQLPNKYANVLNEIVSLLSLVKAY